MSLSQEDNLIFSVQSQPALTVKDLLQSLLLACGGNINSSYFHLIDEMDITECLYHLYLFIDLKRKQSPASDNKLDNWGFSDNEFE